MHLAYSGVPVPSSAALILTVSKSQQLGAIPRHTQNYLLLILLRLGRSGILRSRLSQAVYAADSCAQSPGVSRKVCVRLTRGVGWGRAPDDTLGRCALLSVAVST